jgi:hypothetical protein
MVLSTRTVRELIPHLHTFVTTGRMIEPAEEDYQI